MSAMQDPEKELTAAAIEEAARDLEGVELTLWDHSGMKSDGSSTVIRGDGTVVQSWTPAYPLVAEEKTTVRRFRLPLPREEVRKILRRFAVEEVLAMPKTRPDLVGGRERRCTVSLAIAGAGSFEADHPNLQGSRLPQVPAARELIQAIRSAVQELSARIDREDAKTLDDRRLAQLSDGYFIELHDIQGLWGGVSVRVHADGRVEGVSVDRAPGGRPFKGAVDRGAVAGIVRKAAEMGTFGLKPKREFGIPDEARPVLLIQATFDGATYSRSVAMWDGEVRDVPAFQQVRKALLEIAAQGSKK